MSKSGAATRSQLIDKQLAQAGWNVDLAARYGVQTKRLNEQAKRYRESFPSDFLFQLTQDERAEVVANCDHLQNLKFSKAQPFALTEHGAIQAANVLASNQAVEMGIYVVLAYLQLRQSLAANADIAQRLVELETKTESLEMSHDTFSRDVRNTVLLPRIESRIQVLSSLLVMLDVDLTALPMGNLPGRFKHEVQHGLTRRETPRGVS